MRWVHLSDIHLNKELNRVASNVVRGSLLAFLQDNHIEADYLFITGDYRDAAYKGNGQNENEDEAAKNVADYIKEIAKALQVPEQHIFLTPGNHDLDRSVDMSELKDELKRRNASSDGFAPEQRKYLMKRFLFFQKVYQQVRNDMTWGNSIHCLYQEKDVDVLCLNTAITCDGNDIEGELLIDTLAAQEEFDKSNDWHKPLFVLAHHSMQFLTPNDQNALKGLFAKRKTVYYLCGHSHRMGYHVDSSVIEIMVGATKAEEGASPIFAIGEGRNLCIHALIKSYCYDQNNITWRQLKRVSFTGTTGKIEFVGEAFFSGNQDNGNAKVVSLPLAPATATTADTRKQSIAVLAKLKYSPELQETYKYIVSLIGLPVPAAILIGYALNERQNLKLYYQARNEIYANNVQDKQIVFKETKHDKRLRETKQKTNLCIYIQAKEMSDGESIFRQYVKDKMQSAYCVSFINCEIYDETINLEKTAKELIKKILDHQKRCKADKIHLFYNGMSGLALYLGNQMPSTHPVQLYDYDSDGPSYRKSFKLHSKIFNRCDMKLKE